MQGYTVNRGRLASSSGSNKVKIVQMFPMFDETDAHQREFDDYGEVVDFANFLPKEDEKEDEVEAFVPVRGCFKFIL